jgi:hypothetical protein
VAEAGAPITVVAHPGAPLPGPGSALTASAPTPGARGGAGSHAVSPGAVILAGKHIGRLYFERRCRMPRSTVPGARCGDLGSWRGGPWHRGPGQTTPRIAAEGQRAMDAAPGVGGGWVALTGTRTIEMGQAGGVYGGTAQFIIGWAAPYVV